MKIISTPESGNKEDLRHKTAPLIPVSLATQDIRKNRHAIIEGGLSVESLLGDIICLFFFGDTNPRKEIFELMIVRSSWCTYAGKMGLIKVIVENEELLGIEELEEFIEELAEVSRWRDAFMHGSISVDMTDENMGDISLFYFESKPIKKLVTDALLTEIENTITEAFNKCLWIYSRLKKKREPSSREYAQQRHA